MLFKTFYRDANCSDFIGSFLIFAFPFRYYDTIELSSDFLGDLIIIFLVHFISRLLIERADFLKSILPISIAGHMIVTSNDLVNNFCFTFSDWP